MRFAGKLLFKFTTEGIWFPHKGDEVLWYWPWVKPIFKVNDLIEVYKYQSLTMDRLFTNFSEYKNAFQKSGMTTKIEGFGFAQILHTWIKVHLRHGYYVVLFDINVSCKSSDFWLRIPSSSKKEMVKDVVILRCKSKREVKELCDSINPEFASAVGIDHGNIISVNED